jgi:hypothetical protein
MSARSIQATMRKLLPTGIRGLESRGIPGGYYDELDTAAGPFFFGIHPKKS